MFVLTMLKGENGPVSYTHLDVYKRQILFFITGILISLLRSNGFYAYVLCIPFIIFFMKKKRVQTGDVYKRQQLYDIIDGYTKNYKVVQKAFPSLTEEAECLWLWSRFIVLDKMLLEENYRTIEGRKELVLFIRRHMRCV